MISKKRTKDRGSIPCRPFPPGSLAGLASVAAVVLCCNVLFAAGLEPFESGGKWGFREADSDRAAVPPIFDLAAGFQDGLAPVMLLGRWGYVDETGSLVLEPKYAEARPFSEGAAEVKLADGQWAVINKAGEIMRLSSSPVLGVPAEGLAVFVKDGKFGYMKPGGKVVIDAEFEGAGAFSEGLAPVKKEKWGFVDRSGRFVIKPGFDAARDFSEGLAAFLKDGKWGFLNRKGAVVVGNKFHDARSFSEGLAAVRINSRWGYIDKKGWIVLWPEYDEARPFSGGRAVVSFPVLAPKGSFPAVVLERRWIDKEGRALYKSRGAAGGGLEIIVSTANKYGYARDLAPVIQPEYEDAGSCGDGGCLVKKGGSYAFIDSSGTTVLETNFEEAAALGCGLYRVRLGLKYGLMSSTGSVIAPDVYDVIEGSGCAGALTAALEGKTGRLDAADGSFLAGLTAADAPPGKLSEKCLQMESLIESIPYNDIPGYCGAEELRSLLKTYPGCLNCRLALVVIYSSAAPAGTADPAAALEALGEAIKISPDDPRLYQWRAALLLSSGRAGARAEELVADYQQLIRIEPGNPAHYRGLCAAYGLSGRAPEERDLAAYYCGKAVKLEPVAGNYVNFGNLKRLMGDAAGAMEYFRLAVNLAPDDAAARLARARLSAELGQDFRTVFDYSKILESDKDNPEVLEERGLAYLRMGECAKALADLEHAGSSRPGAGNLHRLAVYHWRCEKDTFKTLELAESLLKMGEACGGACWRPDDYEKYLADLYTTGRYQELLKKYEVPIAASPVSTPP